MPSSQQTIEPALAPPGEALGRVRRYRYLDRLITNWQTTPGKLRVARTVLVLGVLLSGSVGVYAAAARADTIRDIAEHLEPLNAKVTELYQSLADADATVAAGFLSGGVEPREVRARYDDDVALATARLAQVSAQADEELVTASRVATITTQLPVYTGLVERARANNRQGLAVGVAYLRRASELMQSSILPAAAELQRRQAARLDDAYQRAGAVSVVALAACGASLAGLVWAQIFLFQQTHRVFNIGLLAASAAVLAGLFWWMAAEAASAGPLASSHRHNQAISDALGPAQIAARQARAVESLGLVSRAGGDSEPDFDARMQQLARNDGAGGALGAARQFVTDHKGRALVEAAVREASRYKSAHRQVRELDDRGQYIEAVEAAVSDHETGAAAAFDRLSRALTTAADHERDAFGNDINRARDWLTGLPAGTATLALTAAIGVTLGIQQRLEEYR